MHATPEAPRLNHEALLRILHAPHPRTTLNARPRRPHCSSRVRGRIAAALGREATHREMYLAFAHGE